MYILIINNLLLILLFFYKYKIESPKHDECILDIAIGGWSIPYNLKGFLCVWAISNNGNVKKYFVKFYKNFLLIMLYLQLYFRKDVSLSCLEGTEWLKINLPDKVVVFSCGCSSNGNLWVITFSGK